MSLSFNLTIPRFFSPPSRPNDADVVPAVEAERQRRGQENRPQDEPPLPERRLTPPPPPPPADPDPYYCDVCDEEFENQHQHESFHQKRGYKCIHCGLYFPDRRTIANHLKTHQNHVLVVGGPVATAGGNEAQTKPLHPEVYRDWNGLVEVPLAGNPAPTQNTPSTTIAVGKAESSPVAPTDTRVTETPPLLGMNAYSDPAGHPGCGVVKADEPQLLEEEVVSADDQSYIILEDEIDGEEMAAVKSIMKTEEDAS